MKSENMQLSRSERRWLPWWGAAGKLRLGWSCLINRKLYPVIENIFEGIAGSRRSHVLLWVNTQWDILDSLARQLVQEPASSQAQRLAAWLPQAPDFSELFVVDRQGRVLASTAQGRNGAADLNPRAVAAGLKAPFLHGPYSDAATKALGPSSSQFHDAVTLMFYQPLRRDGVEIGCLCGRVPNDVLGDLIQREAGHVYRDSGDNYIFMVESAFDPAIRPGTALSRSRFEDAVLTLGDNLKQGVRTAYGVVRVQQHTELELRFTDPANDELHPGVRETIARGENLFVTYPGYADYRHVPVIGKGVTLQVKGSPDRWGMMCEADLEEVYRRRPLMFRIARNIGWSAAAVAIAVPLLERFTAIAPSVLWLGGAGLAAAVATALNIAELLRLGRRVDAMSRVLFGIAECGESLGRRIDTALLEQDEAGELGRWINSFVDKIDDTVNSVLGIAGRVTQSSSTLAQLSSAVAQGSQQQSDAAASSTSAVEQIGISIAQVSEHAAATEAIARNASRYSQQGNEVVQEALREMKKSTEAIAELSTLITTLDRRSDEINTIIHAIKGIADQTNLLALNAAIEAARAGDQGRGFSVVADEVRNLAQRTGSSTSDITAMIATIQADTGRAVATMQGCRAQVERSAELAALAGESLDHIRTGAEETVRMVSDIVGATQEQMRTGAQIAQHIEQINRSAQQNSGQIHAAAGAAHGLEQLATDLQKSVGKFSV
jgi:methyl-accepting chemotaxis protein